MAGMADILRRFRAHGVPGAATPAGVPADRRRMIEAELAPVFASLEAPQRQAAAIVRDGAVRAERECALASARAEELAASARRRAETARGEEVARVLADADAEVAVIVEQAKRHAAAIDAATDEATDLLAEQVVAHVLSRYGATGGP